MMDEQINQKESEELKKNHNHYLEKRNEIMKKTNFKVEDVFGVLLSNDKSS